MAMERVHDPGPVITWLEERSDSDGALTGYHARGWEADTWVLHAAYALPEAGDWGTHDDLEKAAVAAGALEPTIVGGVNFSLDLTATGIPVGFVERPAPGWRRTTWAEILGWSSDVISAPYAPSADWFPGAGSELPATIVGPPEGSLDGASFDALAEALGQHTAGGLDTICFALWAVVPSWSQDGPEIWCGRLRDLRDLFGDEESGRRYDLSPSNLWPADRSWFVCTDYDLNSTHVSGDASLIRAVEAHQDIEAITWVQSASE